MRDVWWEEGRVMGGKVKVVSCVEGEGRRGGEEWA